MAIFKRDDIVIKYGGDDSRFQKVNRRVMTTGKKLRGFFADIGSSIKGIFGRTLVGSIAAGGAAFAALTKNAVAFGDSITAGTGASDADHRWINVLATAKNWQFQNSGDGGTVLQNTVQNTVATIGDAADDNGRDTYAARITAYSPDWVLILYGLNDLRLDDAAFTVDLFETDLGEVVDGIVAAGTPADHIVIGSPPYMNDYSAGAPWDGGSEADHQAHVAKCAAVATAKGTRYIDVYQWMVDNGDDALVADGIHPNDDGHAAIAAAFLSVL